MEDNVKSLKALPAASDRQPFWGSGYLKQVMVIHKLDQGPNGELVEQLSRGGVPNGGAYRLDGSVSMVD